jgi:hypothetical protein
MIFQDEQQIFDFIKENKQVSPEILKARDYKRSLLALIDGHGFIDELINKIEFIETSDRIRARKKYSRNITDTFERLFQPISNVFHSTGGSFTVDITNQKEKEDFLMKLANVRDEKSLKQYVESDWLPLYHIDPNGLIFVEYTTDNDTIDAYPTYKGIDSIRTYKRNGQLTELVLFEPIRVNSDKVKNIWRLVDGLNDYTILEVAENVFVIDEEKTFEHPFGQPPAILISNIIDINSDMRLSPIHKLIDIMREYANNQSVKSLYKIIQGNPIHWRVGSQCQTCRGRKKVTNAEGQSNKCSDCGGTGTYETKDVTDERVIPYPREGEVSVLPDIAGYISPDLPTWQQFTDELIYLEKHAYQTLWGISQDPETSETATGRFIDQQPMLNRLNKYADVSEWVQWKIGELIADVMVASKKPSEKVTTLSYGRRFILETPDALLNKYEEAKKEGDSTVVLDRILNEYVTSKYSNDTDTLRKQLIKAKYEPHIHYTIEQVQSIYGDEEAQKKGLFSKFWRELDKDSVDENLGSDFDKWYEINKVTIKTNNNED